MSQDLEYLSTAGEWIYRRSEPGGTLRVVCSQRRATHTDRCWLLGRFHHHGVFTPVSGEPVVFVGGETDDYPAEVLEGLGIKAAKVSP